MARIFTSVSSKLAHGDAVEILSESTDRIKPICNHAIPGGCGGCHFQHLSYEEQLEIKKEILKEQLWRIGKIKNIPKSINHL